MPPVKNAVPHQPPAPPPPPPPKRFAHGIAKAGAANAGRTAPAAPKPAAEQPGRALMKEARATNTPVAKHEIHNGADTHTTATANSMTRFKTDLASGAKSVEHVARVEPPPANPIAGGLHKMAEGLGRIGEGAKDVAGAVEAEVDQARTDIKAAWDTVATPVKDFIADRVDAKLRDIDPAGRVSRLENDGDSVTIGGKVSVKGGIGAGKGAMQGFSGEGGVSITATQKGELPNAGSSGSRKPGDTKTGCVEVKVTRNLKVGRYADIDPLKARDRDWGGIKIKAGAEGSIQGTATETYRFNSKAEAAEAVRTIQRNEIGSLITGSQDGGDLRNHDIPRASGFLAPSPDAQARLDKARVGTTDAIGVQGKVSVEGKLEMQTLEDAIPPGAKKPDFLNKFSAGLQPGAEVNGHVEHGYVEARGKPGDKGYKPAQLLTTVRLDASASNKSGVQAKENSGRDHHGKDEKRTPIEVGIKDTRGDEIGRMIREVTYAQDLTPAEAAKLEARNGGTFITRLTDGIPPLDRPVSSTTFKSADVGVNGINPQNGRLQYGRTETTTTVKSPATNEQLRKADDATFINDEEALAGQAGGNVATTVDRRDFERDGAEFTHELSVDASGVFEGKLAFVDRRSNDTVLAHSKAEYPPKEPKAETFGQKPLNQGDSRVAYNNIEAQLLGIGNEKTRLQPGKPDTPGNTFETRGVPRTGGTSPWELARVSEGRNHGHPTIAAANSVNAVLRDNGVIGRTGSVANSTEARQKLGELYARSTPEQREAMTKRLSNGIGEDWGLQDIADANKAREQEPAAKHFRDPFNRAEAQRGAGGRSVDPARPDDDPRRYGPAR